MPGASNFRSHSCKHMHTPAQARFSRQYIAFCDPQESLHFTLLLLSAENHPFSPHLLATGSYDERVRLWDTRNMRAPLSMCGASRQSGGGIWKVKWHPSPSYPFLLLAAGMRSGAFVVDTREKASEPNQLLMLSHQLQPPVSSEALAYGVDWCKTPTRHFFLCSYYNRGFTMEKINLSRES